MLSIRTSTIAAACIALVAGVLSPAVASAQPAVAPAQPAVASAQPTGASPAVAATADRPGGLNDAAPTAAGMRAAGTRHAMPSWRAASPDAAAVPLTAADTVCVLTCDGAAATGLAADERPVRAASVGGRSVQLHASVSDGVAWAVVPAARKGDTTWVERSFDQGATRTQPIAPTTATSAARTETPVVNVSDPVDHRRGVVRACVRTAQGATACTDWAYRAACDRVCDGVPHGTATDQRLGSAGLAGRRVTLHADEHSAGWAGVTGAAPGDAVWLERSWNEGASVAGGTDLGRTTVSSGASSAETTAVVAAEPRFKLAGGSLRACLLVAGSQQRVCTQWARPAVDRVAAAADALVYDYDPYEAWWHSSWWNSAVAITTVIDYQRTTGDSRYAWMIDRTFEVNKASFPAGVKSTDPLPGNFVSRAIDDGGWWALAWIRAYDLTGDAKYLQSAEYIGDYMYSYWDDTCGGGVWWNGEKTYKNAVVNGQFIEIAAELHQRITGDSDWLSRAVAGWDWYRQVGMTGADGLVNDGITDGCENNGQTVYTYNQGLAIGNGVALYRATGDTAYLEDARAHADAAIHSGTIVQGGVLTEVCDPLTAENPCDDNAKQFKGVYMRYATELDRATNGAYRAFDRTQANTVWQRDRDPLNRLGVRWNGQEAAGKPNVRDWRTQASALSALLAVG